MIKDPCNLNSSELLEWAYSEDIDLIDQDEDLLLHDMRYMPTLLEFVRDIECPKADYIFSIICHYAQTRLLHKKIEETEFLSTEIVKQSNLEGGQRIEELNFIVQTHAMLAEPKSISEQEANLLAYDLLIRETVRELIKFKHQQNGYYEYTYKAPYPNYLYINLNSGLWLYSKTAPLKSLP